MIEDILNFSWDRVDPGWFALIVLGLVTYFWIWPNIDKWLEAARTDRTEERNRFFTGLAEMSKSHEKRDERLVRSIDANAEVIRKNTEAIDRLRETVLTRDK